jgi:hypothetical protein
MPNSAAARPKAAAPKNRRRSLLISSDIYQSPLRFEQVYCRVTP